MSSVDFFNVGEMMEFLRCGWNLPEESEKLTMLVMVGISRVEHCLRSQVGMGSRSHCLLGASVSILRISWCVAGEKEEKPAGVAGGGERMRRVRGRGVRKGETKFGDFVREKGCEDTRKGRRWVGGWKRRRRFAM